MIEIDGGMGEAGGQLLRTSLSLSCITGKPFRIFDIRKARKKPGLMPQHLVCVQAAARISGAEIAGAEQGSRDLTFVPAQVQPGNYSFPIGTAGATSMVLQTVVPALLFTGSESRLLFSGGTHVPFSPPWDYLTDVFAPAVKKLGVMLSLTLERHGFYPKGGGAVRCKVEPVSSLVPLAARERGALRRISGVAAVANLPVSIAEREAASAVHVIREALGADTPCEVRVKEVKAFGAGTFIFLKAEYEESIAGFSAIGERGKRAETVGEEAAQEMVQHHRAGAPIDPHLADQMVLYLPLCREPSVFFTSRITGHLLTNLEVTGRFLHFSYEVAGDRGGPGTVRIRPL
ncbi:RNA 3'-phosphate cyclase [Geomonas sp. RF6]|uniref:RNA 3'-terminal phosphate cyclase n=1 Tax=Geomonas sp. RF6 TaxID=2897342 RepID=UPI001E656BEA|nr:RNA 3'-terminal phosphate cyclase [Geomonas sp. RF6]UFS70302.1 RNA 3'-phosphate cyclase [Geomonas sp. RF6]